MILDLLILTIQLTEILKFNWANIEEFGCTSG